jgi:hypothetical protein
VASTLFPPCSVTNIFGNWLNRIDNRFKKHIRVGAIAFIWSIWLCRNDKVFNDKNSSMLQVIYRAIGTLCLWSSLQRLYDRDLYTEVCARLEATVRDTFSQHGWPHSLRIDASSYAILQLLTMICNFAFILSVETCFGAVCILVMERPGVSLMTIK